jgi:hypothetical protein
MAWKPAGLQASHRSIELWPLGCFVFLKLSFIRSFSATFRLPLWDQGSESKIFLKRHAIARLTNKRPGGRKLGVVWMGMAQTELEESIDMHSTHPTLFYH